VCFGVWGKAEGEPGGRGGSDLTFGFQSSFAGRSGESADANVKQPIHNLSTHSPSNKAHRQAISETALAAPDDIDVLDEVSSELLSLLGKHRFALMSMILVMSGAVLTPRQLVDVHVLW